MALFNLNALKSTLKSSSQLQGFDDDTQDTILFSRNDLLTEKLPSLAPNTTYHFVSAGDWSAHDVLMHLLELLGPSTVYITTWTATEKPIRLLTDALISKKIRQLHLLFDVRMPHRTPAVFQLAAMHATSIKVDRCHAKVMVVDNGKLRATVISSQNMTNNPRIEAGIISTSWKIGSFHIDWIKQVLADAKPFDS